MAVVMTEMVKQCGLFEIIEEEDMSAEFREGCTVPENWRMAMIAPFYKIKEEWSD